MSDPFEQIGAKLREARQAAGLEIDEAVRQSQVPRAVVEALEAEDFSHFLSPVYAKSFLMQYSEFLQVDAKTWLDALEPGSFMASGAVLNGREAPREQAASVSQERGGVIAVFGLLLLSAAIVVGAIKGYELFEAHFGELEMASPAGNPAPEDEGPQGAIPGIREPALDGVQ